MPCKRSVQQFFQLPPGRRSFEALKRGGRRHQWIGSSLPLSSPTRQAARQAEQGKANPVGSALCLPSPPTPSYPSNCFHSTVILFHLPSTLSPLSWQNSTLARLIISNSQMLRHCDIPLCFSIVTFLSLLLSTKEPPSTLPVCSCHLHLPPYIVTLYSQ